MYKTIKLNINLDLSDRNIESYKEFYSPFPNNNKPTFWLNKDNQLCWWENPIGESDLVSFRCKLPRTTHLVIAFTDQQIHRFADSLYECIKDQYDEVSFVEVPDHN